MCLRGAQPRSIPWWRCDTSNRSQIPQHDSHAAEADHAVLRPARIQEGWLSSADLICPARNGIILYTQFTQLLKNLVAVEKPPLLKKLSRRRYRKCPPKSRTSFIGHLSAMKFL